MISSFVSGVAPSRAIYFWAYSTSKATLNRRLPPNTEIVHMMSAATAGLLSSCTTNPLWVIKTRMQLERQRNGNSLVQVIKNIYKERGIRGFWRGVSASAYGISETVMHFVIYEKLKGKWAEHQMQNNADNSKKTVIDFLAMMGCGGISKSVATSLAYPHEVAVRVTELANSRPAIGQFEPKQLSHWLLLENSFIPNLRWREQDFERLVKNTPHFGEHCPLFIEKRALEVYTEDWAQTW